MNSKVIILIASFAFIILNHFFGFSGHYGYDDMEYAKLANDLNNGIIDWNNHYSHRLSVLGITSFSYRIFGINEFASALPALLASLGVLALVFIMVRKESTFHITLAMSLTCFSNWWIYYSDKLMPDMLVCFSIISCCYFLYRDRFKKPHTYLINALGFSISLFIGFFAKGTIILALPVFIFILFKDLLNRKSMKIWTYSGIFSLVLLSLYFLMIWKSTGSALIRLEAIHLNTYDNPCNYQLQDIFAVLYRITFGYIFLLIKSGIIIPYLFIIASLSRRRMHMVFDISQPHTFLRAFAMILLLSSNFMTISWTGYNPICLDPRHHLFLIPIAALAAIHFFNSKHSNKKFKLIVLISGTAIIASYIEILLVFKIYIPLLLATYILLYLHHFKKLAMVFFIIALFSNPLSLILNSIELNYRGQRKFIQENIPFENKVNVYTHKVESRIINYDLKFDTESNFFRLKDLDERNDSLEIYIILNKYTRHLSGEDKLDLSMYNLDRLAEDRDLGITIYKILP
jgi:hypothetical protein